MWTRTIPTDAGPYLLSSSFMRTFPSNFVFGRGRATITGRESCHGSVSVASRHTIQL